jgi:hypothetical protein
MFNMPKHTYEEIRGLTIDFLLAAPNGQFNDLVEAVGKTLLKKHNHWPLPPGFTGVAYPGVGALLHQDDSPTILEVFWDLFRQGAVTLGRDAQQGGWPWYRLSRLGRQLAQQGLFRFHDTTAYIDMVKTYVPDISSEAVTYLEEAVASFYADCLLASSVMLGVAAESEFLRLVSTAIGSATYGTQFAEVSKPSFIRQKIIRFQKLLEPIIPALNKTATEDLETNFNAIQSLLRIARNEAGHPTAGMPTREQVYVNLQLFAPLARQFMRLRQELV